MTRAVKKTGHFSYMQRDARLRTVSLEKFKLVSFNQSNQMYDIFLV